MTEREKKPAHIIYGLDDPIPGNVIVPLVLQQMGALSMDLVLPVLIISAMDGPRELAQSLVSLMMIGIGVGTILQAWRKGPSGSGYLCAEETGFLYFQASTLAVQTGGLSLLFGMTALSGFFQMLLSKFIQRLRFLFPTEVAGLMVAMTGIAGIPAGMASIFGSNDLRASLDLNSAWIGLGVLSIMVAFNIWGNLVLRQYSIFLGMATGYAISYATGLLTPSDTHQLMNAPFMALPALSFDWSFDGRLVLPFMVAVLCSSLKTMGNLAVCQKANNANWNRVDINNVGRGIFAEGLGTLFCGLLGCMGLNSSSSSVGLSLSTGVTSRRLAYLIGGTFIALAFFPQAAAAFSIMPAPVMGAVLLLNLGYFIIEGFRIITSRMLDDRKIFLVGLSLVFGLSVDMLPAVYAQFPESLQPIFRSSLTVVSLTAIILNLIFRIGIKKRRLLEVVLEPGSNDKVIEFMEVSGEAWGARDEVVRRASSATLEFIEMASELNLTSNSKLKLEVTFDEYNLNVHIAYIGIPMDFPIKRPTEEELLTDDKAIIRLSGFLIRKYAKRLESGVDGEFCYVHFYFDH